LSHHQLVGEARRLIRRHTPLLLVLGAAALAVVLRAPWFSTPLGNDEAGLTFVSAHAHGGGPFEYGSTFIDRPPLLLGIFHLAGELGGTAAVRTFGAMAVGLLVFLVALVARELGGTRAAVGAAFIAAVLGSSPALTSVLTPAELLAVLPSTASVLALLVGRRLVGGRSLACFALAGSLAVAALLVKQSFGDALLAGAVCLGLGLYLAGSDRGGWLRSAAAYGAGVCVAVLGLELWEQLYGVPDGTASYALLGFRLDGLGVLSSSLGAVIDRMVERLLIPALASGLVAVAIVAGFGLRQLSGARVVQGTIAAWALGGGAAVLLGGSYWSHYLIELVPVLAVAAGVAVSTAPKRLVQVAAAVLAVFALSGPSLAPALGESTHAAGEARDIGSYVSGRSRPDDSIYVLYSEPNVIYYSGLKTPFPYAWSLMVRAVPGAQHELRALLESRARPTWIVGWESPSSYGLDASERTADLLTRHYRRVASVCGRPILLREDVHRPGAAPLPTACG